VDKPVLLAKARDYLVALGFEEVNPTSDRVVFRDPARNVDFALAVKTLLSDADLSSLRRLLVSHHYVVGAAFDEWARSRTGRDTRPPSQTASRSRLTHDLVRPGPLVLRRGEHSFFDDLLTFLVAISSIGATYGAHSGRNARWRPQESVTFSGIGRGNRLNVVFYPSDAMDAFAQGSWPDVLRLFVEEQTRRDPQEDFDAPNFVSPLLTAVFVRYYQRIADDYPEAMNSDIGHFARLVRNAFAHDGSVRMALQGVRARWRDIEYSPDDNGKRILGVDLGPVEIFQLMFDLDALLP
jgi:hypothetical protein